DFAPVPRCKRLRDVRGDRSRDRGVHQCVTLSEATQHAFEQAGIGRRDTGSCLCGGEIGVVRAPGRLVHGAHIDESIRTEVVEVAADGRLRDPKLCSKLFHAHFAPAHDHFKDTVSSSLHTASLRPYTGFWYFVVIKVLDTAQRPGHWPRLAHAPAVRRPLGHRALPSLASS